MSKVGNAFTGEINGSHSDRAYIIPLDVVPWFNRQIIAPAKTNDGPFKFPDGTFSLGTTGRLDATTKCIHKWLSKWKWKYFNFFPYFIIIISVIEACIYYLADNKVKRILLYDPQRNKDVWRFLTYMLVHTDSFHLILNLVIQGFLGFPIEFEQGTWKCASIYFAGGLAGSFGAATFCPATLMAGASGGIYALLTSHVTNIILNYATMNNVWYRIFAVTTLIGSDLIHILYHVWLYNNESPKIGWVAHASGGIAGFFVGGLIFSGKSKYKKEVQIASCSILATTLIGIGIYHFSEIPFR